MGETYPAQYASAGAQLRGETRRRPCAMSVSTGVAGEVELVAKDARVELRAGLEGEEAVDVPAGEQEVEEGIEGRGGRGVDGVEGDVGEDVEGDALEMRRHDMTKEEAGHEP